MSDTCAIHSIYRATEGEGLFIGTPQIFVRFQGCNIGCVNCDSKDTWEFNDKSWPLSQVIEEIYSQSGHYPHQLKRVSLTGGDPLHPKIAPGTLSLARVLKKEGFFISIEAAGTRVINELFDVVDFINFDLKTPSTGVRTPLSLIEKMYEQYPNRFQVKAVIADKRDFDYAFEAYKSVQSKQETLLTNWCLTPCYEKDEKFPKERFLEIINLNEQHGGAFRVIGQQHKWLHGPNETNV